MKVGQATGLQIAFLVYAVMLLTVPLSNFVVAQGALEGWGRALVEKGAHFALAAVLIASVPQLRKLALRELARPIPRGMRIEVAAVAILDIVKTFGAVAALALWFLAADGPARVDRMIVDVDREVSHAYSGPGLVRLFMAVFVAPVLEEIVFRGLLYRAFERQWGWIASLWATSALFGLYHAHFWSAFFGSFLFVCVMRRTGTLRSAILVHMFYNLMLWWPLLGQHVFPHSAPLLQLSTWWFHGACLLFSAVALPIYVWMSREHGGALQK